MHPTGRRQRRPLPDPVCCAFPWMSHRLNQPALCSWAYIKLAPMTQAKVRFGSVRSAPVRLVPTNLAPCRLAPAGGRYQCSRAAQVRSYLPDQELFGSADRNQPAVAHQNVGIWYFPSSDIRRNITCLPIDHGSSNLIREFGENFGHIVQLTALRTQPPVPLSILYQPCAV